MSSLYLVKNLLTKKLLLNHIKKKRIRDQRETTIMTKVIDTKENLVNNVTTTMTVWIEGVMIITIENHEIMIVNVEAVVEEIENNTKRKIIPSIQIPTLESSILMILNFTK
tara:strand:- start:1423 stop:1755 length:333 start_codon:yes stop_codon:yes gene_type:complete